MFENENYIRPELSLLFTCLGLLGCYGFHDVEFLF